MRGVRDEADRGLPRVNVTGRRNELRLRRLNLRSNAKEYAMKTLTTGIVAAATLLSAAPAFAIDIGGRTRRHQDRSPLPGS